MSRKHTHRLSAIILLLTLLITATLCNDDGTPGLHCFSDDECKNFDLKADKMYLLGIAIDETDDKRMYKNGENIACLAGYASIAKHNIGMKKGGLCAWVWNTDNTVTGLKIRPAVKILQAHCGWCGSAPLDPSANNLATGEVTIGWSDNPQGCSGKCTEWGGSHFGPGDIVPGAHA